MINLKRVTVLIVLSMALAACSALRGTKPEPAATDNPLVNMPNPASVYCEQNGNQLEILTAEDGSQSGTCVFPDGSACEEWAYFRGECGPAENKSPTPGLVVESTSAANVSSHENDAGGYMPTGTEEKIVGWRGVIRSSEPGAEYDDYFERQDLGQPILFGIDSSDPAVKSQIIALRDSGKILQIDGTLLSNVPDYNGSRIQVSRVEIDE